MVKISLPAWDMDIVLKNKSIDHLNIYYFLNGFQIVNGQ